MSMELKQAILQKIKDYKRIFIFRHVRNDGDCVGASKGLKAILTSSFPEKEIYLIDEETAAYLEFMGPEDAPVETALYEDALGRNFHQANVLNDHAVHFRQNLFQNQRIGLLTGKHQLAVFFLRIPQSQDIFISCCLYRHEFTLLNPT